MEKKNETNEGLLVGQIISTLQMMYQEKERQVSIATGSATEEAKELT